MKINLTRTLATLLILSAANCQVLKAAPVQKECIPIDPDRMTPEEESFRDWCATDLGGTISFPDPSSTEICCDLPNQPAQPAQPTNSSQPKNPPAPPSSTPEPQTKNDYNSIGKLMP
jgi:hypothetical protein